MTLRAKWRPGDRFLVRHKDAAIVVVEKKAGVLSQKTESGRGEDLLGLLRAFLGVRGRGPGLYPVHRLDRVVSGLLVYARRVDAQQRLIEQFARHDVLRRYLAAVRGVLPEERGTFESTLITTDRSLRVYSTDDPSEPGARHAVTHWRVLERFERAKATLVEVELETGIRNQIRVHFAEAGFPLLGERKYRSDEAESGSQGVQRIFLHAADLGFVHPLSGEEMRFHAPLPPDLVRWKAKLSGGGGPRPDRSAPRRTGGGPRHRRRKKR